MNIQPSDQVINFMRRGGFPQGDVRRNYVWPQADAQAAKAEEDQAQR